MPKRSKTPSFVLELKLQTTAKDNQVLIKRFSLASRTKNMLITHAKHRLNALNNIPRYHVLRQQYRLLCDAKDKMTDKKTIAEVEKELSAVKKELSNLTTSSGLTKNDFEKYLKVQAKKYRNFLDAQTVQMIANDVYNGASKVLYGNGQNLHHQQNNALLTLSGKTNKQGIRFKDNRVLWLGLDIGIQVKKGDAYAKEALKHRVKYCRIVRKMIGSRWHFYVQLILEGMPPIKHQPGTGTVGIDNGTSVFAVSSENSGVFFEVLGAKSDDLDSKIEIIQQMIDRSMRANNPDNYNEDGTTKKGHHKWTYSRRCRVLRRRLKSLLRKKAARQKNKNDEIANHILAQGDRFITEPIKLKALQRRVKQTTMNPKTKSPNKKKRFGKSIAKHSPGAVIEALDRKANYFGLSVEKVALSTYRASQYDHISGSYQKKPLGQRWTKVGDSWKQRDLYSAFLLRCPNQALDEIDRDICIQQYDAFTKAHDGYIAMLKSSGTKLPDCCGIHFPKAA